jgi:hypothetical protein
LRYGLGENVAALKRVDDDVRQVLGGPEITGHRYEITCLTPAGVSVVVPVHEVATFYRID